MPIGASNGLFPATNAASPAAAELWKPVGRTADGNGGLSALDRAFRPADVDGVSVSPLGKALSGAAAKLFEKLDTKARGMLEDLVSSGRMSAEEVVKGLRGIAKDAVARRYRDEAPLTEEEQRREDANRARWDKQAAYENGLSSILKEMSADRRADRHPDDSDTRSDHSLDGLRARTVEIKEYFQREEARQDRIRSYKTAFEAENGPLEPIDHEAIGDQFMRKRRDIQRSDLFSGEADSDPFSKADKEAADTLRDLGFTARVYREAAKSYAADVDLDAVGAAAAAADSGTDAAPPAAASAQRSNGESALSLLGAGNGLSGAAAKPAAADSGPPEAVESLLQALKGRKSLLV